ncbi:MAG: DUF3857 and transglutaminase domain-containing protein [Proteobacteria bacterium]|nr:DUF3857 and transglutaminase domain-containing protein [Pseudomonadota bacterium]MCP4915857.1 DUF3857 and transglutaminase domain-containing protein [Pseudomonadota bacterium]
MWLTLPALTLAALETGPTPSWVEPPDVPVLVPPPRGVVLPHTQYLLVDDQTRLHAQGGATRFVHRSYRIVTREGLEAAGQLEIAFDPSSERLVFHDLEVHRDGAWSSRTADAHTAVIQPEQDLWQGLLTGERSLVVLVPDLTVGDVVRYSYSLEMNDPVFEGRWTDAFQIAWDVPVLLRSVRIEADPGRHASVRVLGADGREEDGLTTWRWTARGLPAVIPEWNVPTDVVEYPHIHGSEFQTWGEVVEWALPLYTWSGELDAPELDDATAALDWVQDDVRYVGIELGEGSHTPRSPDTVQRLRYGDCKDKTLLLITLLREQGVVAWPALVNSGSAPIDTWLPSPGAFDHVIVYVEDRGGGYYVDPTSALQGGDVRDRYVPDYGYALLVRPGETELLRMSRGDDSEGTSELTWAYDVPVLGSPRMQTTTRATGGRADNLRSWFASVSEAELAGDLLGQLQRTDLQIFPTDDITVVDDVASNVVQLDEHYRLADAWTLDEDGVEFFPLYELSIYDLLPYAEQSRTRPLALPVGTHEVERIVLDTPPDWSFDDRSGVVSNRWFRWEVQSTARRGHLEERYELEVLSDRVETSELIAYQDALNEVQGWSGFTLERETRDSASVPEWTWGAVVGLVVGGGAMLPLGVGLGMLLMLGRRK